MFYLKYNLAPAVIVIQKLVGHIVFMVSDHFPEINICHAVKNIGLDFTADFSKLRDQFLHLIPLGTTPAAAADAVFRKTAGTLDKMQTIIISPGFDVLLFHQIQRTDQLIFPVSK